MRFDCSGLIIYCDLIKKKLVWGKKKTHHMLMVLVETDQYIMWGSHASDDCLRVNSKNCIKTQRDVFFFFFAITSRRYSIRCTVKQLCRCSTCRFVPVVRSREKPPTLQLCKSCNLRQLKGVAQLISPTLLHGGDVATEALAPAAGH